jgi:TPR repeat protein
MEKAATLFTVLILWLLAPAWANGAGLLEQQTTINRAKHVASARTANSSSLQAKAKADAMLGFKYEHGLGVPQSYEMAADLYLRAAEMGDPTGQYLLGLMYNKGHGVWQDGILAYKWLNLAAARAPARVREHYLRVRDAAASKLTQDQIYMGQTLALQWVPKPQP